MRPHIVLKELLSTTRSQYHGDPSLSKKRPRGYRRTRRGHQPRGKIPYLMKTAGGCGPGRRPNNVGNTTGPGISLQSERNTTGSADAKTAKQPRKPASAGAAPTLLSPTVADAKPAPKSTGSTLSPGELDKNPNESSTNKVVRQAQHSIWDPRQENPRARKPIPSNTNVGNSKPPRPSASASNAPSPQYPDRPSASHALRSTASTAARTTETVGQGRKLNGNSPAALEHCTRPMQNNPSDPTPRRVFFEMHSARIGRLSRRGGQSDDGPLSVRSLLTSSWQLHASPQAHPRPKGIIFAQTTTGPAQLVPYDQRLQVSHSAPHGLWSTTGTAGNRPPLEKTSASDLREISVRPRNA